MPDIETPSQHGAASTDKWHERPGGVDPIGAERRVSAAFWLYVGTVAVGVVACLAWTAAGWGPFGR